MVIVNTYKGHEINYANGRFTTMNTDYASEKDCLDAIDLAMKETERKEKLEKEKKEKARLTNPFKIMLAEPSYLKEPISNIKDVCNEVIIKIDSEKVKIVAMDPANVTMVIYELFSSSAVEWKAEEADVSVNLGKLYSFLKNCEKNDMLIFERKAGNKNATLVFKGAIEREYTIPFYELDERESRIPELKFASRTVMKTSNFKKIVTFANDVAETLKIEAETGKISFIAKDDESEFKCSILDAKDTCTVGVSSSKYSIEYLKLFPCPFVEMMELEGGKDFPLRITMTCHERFMLRFILAPRMDND